MLHLYSWPTPNGHKIHIMLAELGVPYQLHPVNIMKGEQLTPDFLKINPNNKIPVLVDEGETASKTLTIFESGAILFYLGEKYQKFLGQNTSGKYQVLQWLMFQMSGLGPILGQTHHFRHYAPQPVIYGIERFTKEAKRLYQVLDKQLQQTPFLAGDYSIADMAAFPWVRLWQKQGQQIADFPHVKRWLETIEQRPAVQQGLQVMAEFADQLPKSAAWTNQFYQENRQLA